MVKLFMLILLNQVFPYFLVFLIFILSQFHIHLEVSINQRLPELLISQNIGGEKTVILNRFHLFLSGLII